MRPHDVRRVPPGSNDMYRMSTSYVGDTFSVLQRAVPIMMTELRNYGDGEYVGRVVVRERKGVVHQAAGPTRPPVGAFFPCS